jgi:imidazolonepropionase-like amidohydrolase
MSQILVRGGELLDPEQSDLQGPHDILIEDGVIREVSDRPRHAGSAEVIDARGLTVMPGLIDLHVHVTATHLDVTAALREPNALTALRASHLMRAMLRRGFTTVRDAGGADWGLKQAVEQGVAVGPRLFISGHALSQTGGHGDGRKRSDFLSPCGCCFRVGQLSRVVDGVDAVRKATREELQMGADQIKVMASGGVASPTDPVGSFGFSEEELMAIVDEAAARDTYVLAHAYTAQAIDRAVRCGIRTIEHANLIDDNAAELMNERHAFAVPTLVTYGALKKEGARLGLPPESVAKIDDVLDAGLRSLEILKRADVAMGFGTDLLGELQNLQSNEFAIRAEVLSTQEILQSATTTAAKILKMEGKLGRLAAGATADLILVNGNPLTNIRCLLGQGDHIPLVMKRGQVFFGP